MRLAEQRLDRVARHTSSLLSSARAEEKAAFATEKRALAARLQAQEQKLEGLLAVRYLLRAISMSTCPHSF